MRRIATIVWNFQERRLRAGYRVILFFLLWGMGPALLHLVLDRLLQGLIGRGGEWALSIYLNLVRLAAVLVGAWVAARWVDHRPFANYGFHFGRRWWLDLAFGLALGAALMTAIFSFQWLAGWITVTGTWVSTVPTASFVQVIWMPVVLFAVVAIAEELLSRGDQILNLTEGFGGLGRRVDLLLAWVVSSSIFGFLHFFNPNSTWMSTTNLVLAGFFLGLGYVLTGELAISIGLHFTWNFFQGNVFGFPVSGTDVHGGTVLAIQQSGPALWTGGAFGPEAGLLGLLSMLAGAALILVWVKWRHGNLTFDRLYAHTFRAERMRREEQGVQ